MQTVERWCQVVDGGGALMWWDPLLLFTAMSQPRVHVCDEHMKDGERKCPGMILRS